jgi:homocysteine S-methyltransferase
MPTGFLEELDAAPMVADGAMGALLVARGGYSSERCLEELNLSRPAEVQSIHQGYLDAGARLIGTNTFRAGRIALMEWGLEDKSDAINKAGVRLAREAREVTGHPAYIAGAVGPVGRSLEPFGLLKPEEARESFLRQMDVLISSGADLILLETFGDLHEVVLAVESAKAVGGVPVIAEMTFTQDQKTPTGHTPEQVIAALLDAGADVVGANCSSGPEWIRRVVARMAAAAPTARLSAMPNAGFPSLSHGRVVYQATPAYFAEYARKYLDHGVRLIGGCCGTTPKHIHAMAEVVHAAEPAGRAAEPPRAEPAAPAPPVTAGKPADGEARTTLLGKIQRGEFVVSVELDPPKGINAGKILRGAELYRDLGVDAINIADSPMARVRMGCLSLANLIQARTGVETIIHFTCRDRNLMGLQSDLLGAHALGIRNILALTGDPTRLGDYAATDVYDVDAIGLIKIIRRMNEGFDTAGNSIGRPARFTIACALNPSHPEGLDWELGRFEKKLEAGADFIMTQPLWDLDTLWHVLDRIGRPEVPIVFGILPLHSSRQAEFLHNEVPGMTIPEAVRKDLREAGDKALDYGIRQAQQLLLDCKQRVAGVYMMPSFGKYEVVAEVLGALK